jgi:hypothetical protein
MEKNKCPWCGSEDTFLLGAENFISYHHCGSCYADYPVDNRDIAWNQKELEQQKENK